MKKKLALVLVLFLAFILNADFFGRSSWLTKDTSLQKGEITVFALKTAEKRYLDKSKIKSEDLLKYALDAVQDSLPETLISYDKTKKVINLQIYNKKYVLKVRNLRDVVDVAYALRSVYVQLDKEYVPEPPLTKDDIEYIAINGILKKLDPHSYIFTPKDFEDFEKSTGGNFGGLGIVVGMNDNGEITVISPMKGTPATRAGIEANDVIVQIDDTSAVNLTLDKAVSKMRGEPGTQITLMIRREGVPELLKFEITRAIIKITSVLAAMPQPGIGYVNLSGFMENTYSTLVEELDGLKKKGMKALVLDMRNNSGGLLSQAIDISDIFLDKGVIVSTVEDDEEIEANYAKKRRGDILDIPIIVMINEGSASATEIVTAALKKNGRATVLGRKSFGKGSVQTIIGTPGGGGMKLTIAEYLTPGNISIQSVGITPDIETRAVFIHPDKISVFDSGENIIKEGDLEEHIVSQYAPKTVEKPSTIIRYFKEYKDVKTIIKERREQKDDEFRSDEEIEIAVKIAQQMTQNKKAYESSQVIKDEEWKKILAKLQENGINWKEKTSLAKPNNETLKVTMLSDGVFKGGETVKFTFKAEIDGEIENLLGVFESPIKNLRRIEVPFGTFSGSVERTVNVKLPESLQWQKTEGTMKLYLNEPEKKKEIKTEKFMVETIPVEQPDLKFALVAAETNGNRDGLIQSGEAAELTLMIKNEGKGAVLEGKAMLINTNDTEEIFIENGTNAFTLEPGKSMNAKFKFKTEKPAKKEDLAKQKLSLSVYDYKLKYSADFDIPFAIAAKCIFEETGSTVSLPKGTELFSASDLSTKVGSVSAEGNANLTGKCGIAALLDSGLWIKAENTAPAKGNTAIKIENEYPMSMPKIVFDKAPLITDQKSVEIKFEINPDEVKDTFVFLNGKKVFYKRIEKGEKSETIIVNVEMKKKYNRIAVAVTGSDARTKTISKYVTFTKGEDKNSEDDYDEE
ncbi:PDZ domain-containing protein [bacterium]|nr:PDZ domain-containing protein [bacterium]